jgi:lipopolysaccharide biosynthesis glycosyltransferase
MNKSFVTFLATENFLPGVLTLNKSLRLFNKNFDFVVLVTKAISEDCIKILNAANCKTKLVEDIPNPYKNKNDPRGFGHMYTKLRIFEMFEYEKVVYLDADLFICGNIELLFEAPHMSAVIAGGLMPENAAWDTLNAGLLIVEPSPGLWDLLYPSITELPSIDGSDQGFLQEFYQDWPARKELHLSHKFNVPLDHLDTYCEHHGFSFSYIRKKLNTDLAIIHFWGSVKPWQLNIRELSRRSKVKKVQALILWWDIFSSALKDIYP